MVLICVAGRKKIPDVHLCFGNSTVKCCFTSEHLKSSSKILYICIISPSMPKWKIPPTRHVKKLFNSANMKNSSDKAHWKLNQLCTCENYPIVQYMKITPMENYFNSVLILINIRLVLVAITDNEEKNILIPGGSELWGFLRADQQISH